ncbi:MAG: protein-glutamate O-methyltransferase CheR [Verrucomicrobiota bacterium]
MRVSAEDFHYVQGLIQHLAAIALEPGKEYLVETRLTPLVEKEGMSTIQELVNVLRSSTCPQELKDKVVDAMTTNETSFFRDIHPFDTLRTDIMPDIIKRQADIKTLHIWCAACSTGQEPYTISMVLHEHFPEIVKDWNVQILATDISNRVLSQAESGRFGQLEVNRGLPAIYLIKYFSKDKDGAWVVKDEVRRLIKFEKVNLIKPWGYLPTFDVIFIRNVLIYFDVDTKRGILNNICRQLHPDGYLFMGTSESVLHISNVLKPNHVGHSTVFRKILAGAEFT